MTTPAEKLDFNIESDDIDCEENDRILELENALKKATTRLREQIIINNQNEKIISSLEKQIINNYDSDSSCTAFMIATAMCFTPMVISWFL
tara:strand:- start:1382 stop:1654 length:273 start_codon:yes stop_codon:yes gene_type:complete